MALDRQSNIARLAGSLIRHVEPQDDGDPDVIKWICLRPSDYGDSGRVGEPAPGKPERGLGGRTLRAGDRVSVSVRPEDVELTEERPAGDNVWPGRVDQKVFLGEAVDFQVKVGPRTLLSRRHPTLRTKIGEPIWVQLNPEKCVVLKVS